MNEAALMKNTALVTGASRGIGAACAQALAADGRRVIVNYLHAQAKAEALADELGGVAFCADVADSAAVRAMLFAHGPVGTLVCNAGVSLYGLLTDTPEADWRRLLNVNLGGVINCCQAAIPAMVRARYGRIILISSVWGRVGASCEAVYSASKAALHGLTLSLSKELGPSGITVNCVAPGVIDTDMNAPLGEDDVAALTACTPIGTLGTPADVAALVRFLASDDARFVTGQIIGVDGGFAG